MGKRTRPYTAGTHKPPPQTCTPTNLIRTVQGRIRSTSLGGTRPVVAVTPKGGWANGCDRTPHKPDGMRPYTAQTRRKVRLLPQTSSPDLHTHQPDPYCARSHPLHQPWGYKAGGRCHAEGRMGKRMRPYTAQTRRKVRLLPRTSSPDLHTHQPDPYCARSHPLHQPWGYKAGGRCHAEGRMGKRMRPYTAQTRRKVRPLTSAPAHATPGARGECAGSGLPLHALPPTHVRQTFERAPHPRCCMSVCVWCS